MRISPLILKMSSTCLLQVLNEALPLKLNEDQLVYRQNQCQIIIIGEGYPQLRQTLLYPLAPLIPLAHIPAQASQGFVWIARKGKRSTPDMPSLKEVMRSPEASEWKEAMQREYGTWKLVERPTDQHVLTAKWVFKRKRDIDGNIK